MGEIYVETMYTLEELLEIIRVPSTSRSNCINMLEYSDYEHCATCCNRLTRYPPDNRPTYPIWLSEIIRDYALCNKCYNNGKLRSMGRYPKRINSRHSCDWKRFGYSDIECELDIREGWYRRQDSDEDLCLYHGDVLMKSDNKWKSLFRKFETRDVFHRIDYNTAVSDFGVEKLFPAHSIKNLVLPCKIDRIMLTRALTEWMGLEILDSSDRTPGSTWSDIDSVNGNSSFYLIDKYLTTIAEWVPFEFFDKEERSTCCFALVNCNPESRHFHTVATVFGNIGDSLSFNMCFKLFDSKRDSLIRMDLDSVLCNLINLYVYKNNILTYTEYMEGKRNCDQTVNYIETIRKELNQPLD
jgi:hypothetical protein